MAGDMVTPLFRGRGAHVRHRLLKKHGAGSFRTEKNTALEQEPPKKGGRNEGYFRLGASGEEQKKG